MTKELLAALSGSLFSSDQRTLLDTIGMALKQHRIDFQTASELSILVKAGRSDEAIEQLSRPRR